jgi:DNA polymerase-4
MPAQRKIIHLDMDCFYAAIEVRDHPELRGKPVAVGGRSRRGVLTTASYEAREFGVRSAMPTWMALDKCPQLIVVPVRFDVYRRDSARIRKIFRSFTEIIEPLSLDEAYLDVSHLPYEAAAIAAEIRDRIFEETGLTASAGIGPNKLVAKIASDWNKPNGQFEVRDVDAFMRDLPVRRIWGIGRVSGEKLERLGVRTCGQLQKFSKIELHRVFGKFGMELFELCRGIDHRPVEAYRDPKSLSTEQTFEHNISTLVECEERLGGLIEEIESDLRRKGSRRIHKLFVKLKFADFTRTTAECLGEAVSFDRYLELLGEAFRRRNQPVRLMGVGVRFAAAEEAAPQLELPMPE